MSALRFICSSPHWHLSGVNTFTGNLFRELQSRGHDTEIILTETEGRPAPYPLPEGVPVHEFPATRWKENRKRQRLLKDRLIARAPCIYFPNYDFNHVPVIEVLPAEVKVVLTAHSDEEVYYEAIARYGHAANAIVAVSKTIEAKLRERHPEWSEKIVRIPYGVAISDQNERATTDRAPLHVVYSGRLSQHQKRIFDLAEVILSCHANALPVRFSLAGSGPDEDDVKQRLAPAVQAGTVEMKGSLSAQAMNQLFDRADVVILTSDFEGLPLSLLEAMARRCVPVVSRVGSGVAEIIQEDETGRTVAVGDIQGFVAILKQLSEDRTRVTRMADNAAAVIRNGPFNLELTASSYIEVSKKPCAGVSSATRRSGQFKIPAHYSWSYRMAKRLRLNPGSKSSLHSLSYLLIENRLPVSFTWRMRAAYYKFRERPDVTHYSKQINPYRVQWVQPSSVDSISPRGHNAWRTWRGDLGRVLDGDWDLPKAGHSHLSCNEQPIFRSLKAHFIDGVPWEQTPYRETMESFRGLVSDQEWRGRVTRVEALYERIRSGGYKSQMSMIKEGYVARNFFQTLRYEILVDVDRDGRFLFVDGGHRLAIAKLLALPEVPVVVLVRHAKSFERKKTKPARAHQESGRDRQPRKTASACR